MMNRMVRTSATRLSSVSSRSLTRNLNTTIRTQSNMSRSRVATSTSTFTSAILHPHPRSRIHSRSNSTNSSSQDQQLYSSFSTPFSQFLFTISRIARILIFSSLSIFSILAISFESTHQYLEHFKINNPSIADSSTDEYGFQYEHSSESSSNQWTGEPGTFGTDSRLSIKLKHAIRSAWICLNWGTGINPAFYFNSPGGLLGPNRIDSYVTRPNTTGNGAGEGDQEEGLKFAETYLNFALSKCEDLGYRTPEIGQPFNPKEDVDETALKLEIQLANVRERLGNENSIRKSIVGYEKVFQVLITRHENRDREGEGEAEDNALILKRREISSNQKSNLVRLATKLGRLNHEINDRGLAEHWLLKAIEISGNGIKKSDPNPLVDLEKSSQVIEQRKSWIPNWLGGGQSESKSIENSIATSNDQISSQTSIHPTPALTRSLISALLTLSGLYASSPIEKKNSLDKALRIQSDAFSICRLEKERLISQSSSSISKELHHLWLTLNSSIISLHLAQTLYGISDVSKSFLSSGSNEKSKKWLEIALLNSKEVKKSLVTEKIGLVERFKGEDSIEIMAKRLGRDSLRVEEMAEELLEWLQKKEKV